MTNYKKFNANIKREEIMIEQNYYCAVCGNYLYTPELSHRIQKSKAMLKIYGEEIIHHRFNMIVACSSECNKAVVINPNTQPLKRDRLIKKIKEDLCKKK